jgi:hypothetical protein
MPVQLLVTCCVLGNREVVLDDQGQKVSRLQEVTELIGMPLHCGANAFGGLVYGALSWTSTANMQATDAQ